MSATPRTVVLRCPGGYVGTIVAGRYFTTNCRDRRCQATNGAHAVHWWDLETGWMVDDPLEPEAGVTPREEQPHGELRRNSARH